MNKLQEIFDSDFYLLTEKSQLPKYALGKLSYNFAKADEQNLNYRIYPENLMIREIDKKSEELKKAKIAGQLDHPLSGITQLDSAMHILNSVSYDKDTKLASAESFILDTTGGRNFMTLLDAKIPIGASMRSWGTIGTDKKINPDWNFLSIDFVQNPSFGANATIDKSNLIESVDSLTEGNAPSETAIQEILSHCFKGDIEAFGYNRGYETWLTENEDTYRALILVEYGVYPDTKTALKGMGKTDKIERAKAMTEIRHYTDSDCWVEAKFAGVDPKVMAERLNLAEEKKRVNLESDFSEKEAQGLIQEAIAAGKDMSDPKERAKYLKKIAENRTPGEKTIHEKAVDWHNRGLAEGRDYDVNLLEEILRKEEAKAEKKEAIEKRRASIISQCERDEQMSGAFKSNKESREFINKQLKAAGLEILNEEE